LIGYTLAADTISEKAKFLTVLLATFHDNVQALYDIFQYVLTTTNASQSNMSITEEKYHRIVTQSGTGDKIQKRVCFLSQS